MTELGELEETELLHYPNIIAYLTLTYANPPNCKSRLFQRDPMKISNYVNALSANIVSFQTVMCKLKQ